jgi:hypothetical protein
MDVYVTRPLRGVCPHCNNLSPFNHPESSNNSLGFMDTTSAEDRKKLNRGAVWLNLDLELDLLLKAAKGYAKPIKPCIYCILVLQILRHYLPEWYGVF